MTRRHLWIDSGQGVVPAVKDVLPQGLWSSRGDNMGSTWGCWTLCSTLLLGLSQALVLKAPQDSVNGTVGHSVLLPVSYKFTNSSCFPLSFHWTFSNRSDALITCTVLNCSLSAEGAPKHCFAKHFPHAVYRGRVVLFPENASLLLRDLQLSDGGVYSVTFKQQIQTRHITLTVYGRHHGTPRDAGAGAVQQLMRFINQQVQSPSEPWEKWSEADPERIYTNDIYFGKR
ncbi:uncharacterized protein [Struthio camelus]|uniref:uncharacterized protein isoform X2 n=1 Tax=Struthio camelus TaxID=8801 RepID=UPI003603D371